MSLLFTEIKKNYNLIIHGSKIMIDCTTTMCRVNLKYMAIIKGYLEFNYRDIGWQFTFLVKSTKLRETF